MEASKAEVSGTGNAMMVVSWGKKAKTYSRRDSPVVTDLSTNLPIRGLIQDERTGIHALLCLWPYVLIVVSMHII